ncbi:MAG: HyaD/HybD family hydrogenase maturation endopeptidase [Deltaproteobacteria bacterium]|nr:HyaD/HybD family hydrogenase maturation endopeptidase [Deltaproteobacteria bacterium]
MKENLPRILVMGVGNVLLRDEGVGVRVLNEFVARYDTPPEVRLVEGGVLGLNLMPTMMEADKVVVVDAVRGGDEPGTLYRFAWECKPAHIQYKDSLHQIDLMETMGTLPLVGDPPEVVVLGVEYEDIDNWGIGLTPKVEQAVPHLVEMLAEELRQLGAAIEAKEKPEAVANVFGRTSEGS